MASRTTMLISAPEYLKSKQDVRTIDKWPLHEARNDNKQHLLGMMGEKIQEEDQKPMDLENYIGSLHICQV